MTGPRVVPNVRPAITEKQFMAQVVELAQTLGYEVYHPWLSIHSPRGWPDLALVRPPRIILAELKAEKGKTTPHQDRWLDLLRQCDGVEVHLWRPSDFEDVARILR